MLTLDTGAGAKAAAEPTRARARKDFMVVDLYKIFKLKESVSVASFLLSLSDFSLLLQILFLSAKDDDVNFLYVKFVPALRQTCGNFFVEPSGERYVCSQEEEKKKKINAMQLTDTSLTIYPLQQ